MLPIPLNPLHLSRPQIKKELLGSILALGLMSGASLASAQTYQFKQFSPGLKDTAGFLSSNTRNTVEDVQFGKFSLPSTTVQIPSVLRGQPGGAVVELFALGGVVTAQSVEISTLYGTSPLSVSQTNCVGQPISNGQSCAIELSLDTTIGRGEGLAILRVRGVDSQGAPVEDSSSVRWEVLAPDVRLFNAGPMTFPPTAVGATSSPQFFQVGTLSAPLTITGISGAAGFRVSQLSCQTEQGVISAFPVTIRPLATGDTCDVGVVFEPSVSATVSQNLTVHDNDESSTASVVLSGQGTTPRTYATLRNQGRQADSIVVSADSLEFKKAGSWNNWPRFVGTVMRTSGKFYVEVQSSLGLTNFGVTGNNTSYDPVSADRGFNLASSTLPSLENFGLLIDLDNRTLRAVDSGCSITGPVVNLDATSAYTVSFMAHTSNPNNGLMRANLGQYPMNCSFSGFEKGWFSQ